MAAVIKEATPHGQLAALAMWCWMDRHEIARVLESQKFAPKFKKAS